MSTLITALKTWLVPIRYGLERWSYTMQRVSGVTIALYFVLHVASTGQVVGGPAIWALPPYEYAKQVWLQTKDFLANPFFDAGLVVLAFMIFFHSFNGLRLVLAHLGLILEKPTRPEYPYHPGSMSRVQRAIFWVSVVLATAALVYSLDIFFKVLRL